MTMRHRQPSFPRRADQRGVVLFVALVFLVLLTLLAIAASSGSLLQQRMVSATRSAQLADMSADTALRGAEWQLWSQPGLCLAESSDQINSTTGCVRYDPSSSLYAAGGAVQQFRSGTNAWLSLMGPVTYKGANGVGYTDATVPDFTASPNVAQNPQYIIEDLGSLTGGGGPAQGGFNGTQSLAAGNIPIHVYRVTARATGGTGNVVRVVTSVFDAQANH